MAVRRIAKEYTKLQDKKIEGVHSITMDEDNVLHWKGVLSPTVEPYNKASFGIEINFPEKYPFQPPKITFKHPIYHPNVDEKGAICLQTIDPANWKPARQIADVLKDLLNLIHAPEPDHSLRGDVGELFSKDRAEFNKVAAAKAEKQAAKRQ
eukprot:m.257093 g.257093  ORF g.257093 m.257093 type:complete len:152 (-) comp34990_c0_seq1:509-964(-)